MHGPGENLTGAHSDAVGSAADRSGVGMAEFITLCAALCAVAAMSIDIMLPALPAIGQAFGIVNENDRQLVLFLFVITFSGTQLFFGPLSDRFGRKPLMIFGLVCYIAGSVGAMTVTDFNWFLSMRLVQGVGAAPLSVVTMALVRDCFSGQTMGRVLTFVFTTFMIVPIVAPLLGQTIELASSWRGIFAFNGIMAALLLVWMVLRLNETLDVRDRRSLAVASLWSAFVEICTNRITLGYAVASTLTMIGLFSYIISVQQVYGELYGLGSWFPMAFGGSSIGVALAALFSARLVRLFGMRTIAHSALGIFATSGMLLFLLSLAGNPSFPVTFGLLSLCMMAFGVLQGNNNAIAMEPLGHIAGTASSIFGVVTTTTGVIGGGIIGQAYSGTVTPLAFAFGVGGVLALAAVYWTERGRLFGARPA